MSKTSPKTFDEVRAAFENRSILQASRNDLEELLAAAACSKSEDEATRAQVREMGQAMRQFMANRRAAELRRPSNLAVFAILLMAAALLWCGAQIYSARHRAPTVSGTNELADEPNEASQSDHRTSLTIAELATYAPTLRNGSVQAWWAGEQARLVQRLEAQAKQQALAGDLDGAARTAGRANEIRNGIPALADFERSAH